MGHVNGHDGRDEAMAHGRVMTWAGTTRVNASAAGVRSVWLPSWRNGARHEDAGRVSTGPVESVIESGDDPAATAPASPPHRGYGHYPMN